MRRLTFPRSPDHELFRWHPMRGVLAVGMFVVLILLIVVFTAPPVQ